VPTSQILSLRTTTAPTVSRPEYDKTILAPVRDYLSSQGLGDKVRCIVLMWGVPVRVLGPSITPEQQQALTFLKTETDRLRGRLAVQLELARRIGTEFPQPKINGIEPLAALFDVSSLPAPKALPEFGPLQVDLAKEITQRTADAAKLSDPAHRQIALRQLAGLRLAAFGLKNLLENPPEKVPGVPDVATLKEQLTTSSAELDELAKASPTAENLGKILASKLRLDGAVGAGEWAYGQMHLIDPTDRDAAVDSELALLWENDYSLAGPLPNPMNWRLQAATSRPSDTPARVVMACRIDGPTLADARRIILDSVETEKAGLDGTFYIDAGGKYPQYDQNLTLLAGALKKQTKLKVVLDTAPTLFAPGSCPDAALYVGWYSLRQYVPAFTWKKGAVGWHVASFEAEHLRDPNSQEWCVKMIQKGVAATLGAVNEPMLGAFPLPQEFFALLLTGKYTVAECYWKTVPTVSWRMTLIADPLYNPFRQRPQLPIEALPPQMRGQAADR
jgi:uncharacterized protein (TIGR03790 family)